jgi:capping protein beta
VILHLSTGNESLGEMDLSGNMTRQVEADMTVTDGDASHVANVGRLVEDMELKMRNLLQEVYFGKAKDVVGDLRSEFSHFPPHGAFCFKSKSKLELTVRFRHTTVD